MLVGGVPPALLLAAAAAAAAAWAWRERRRPRRVAFALAAVAAAAIAQTAMVAMMVARYPTVTWIDHRFWYYPLPFQALLVVGMLWALERLTLARGSLPRVVPVLLAALVVANLAPVAGAPARDAVGSLVLRRRAPLRAARPLPARADGSSRCSTASTGASTSSAWRCSRASRRAPAPTSPRGTASASPRSATAGSWRRSDVRPIFP